MMIKVFYGDDRVAIKNAIKKALGTQYEVVEGVEIKSGDMPSIFLGGSLLTTKRAILIRDLSENKEIFEKVADFIETTHKIVIFESKIDKRAVFYRKLKDKIEFREFKLPEEIELRAVFDIFRVAKKDGMKAVEMLRNIKMQQKPYMFFGLLVSQAVKDFTYQQGTREKRVLEELSRLDMLMKTTTMEPWLIIESFLVRLSSL